MPTIHITDDMAWVTDKKLVMEFIQELEDLLVNSAIQDGSSERKWVEDVLKYVQDRKAYSQKQHWAMTKIREQAEKKERSWLDDDPNPRGSSSFYNTPY